jgi:phosphonoacetaldehyde hydrolase
MNIIPRFTAKKCNRILNMSSQISKRTFSQSIIYQYPTLTDRSTIETMRQPESSVRDLDYNGPIKSVILDWSGTTADIHVIAPARVFFDVFEKHNVPITMEHARLPMGLRKDLHIAKILEIPEVRQLWMEVKGEDPLVGDNGPAKQGIVDTLFTDFVPMQLACLEEYTGLIDGVAEVTQQMQADGLTIGSTTGFTEVMVDVLLADASKQGYVPDYSVAGDQVANNMGFRPAPFMIYENLVHLGTFPIQSVVKVDDTISGVGEGRTAGCWSVAVREYSNYTDIDTIEQWDDMSLEEQNERIQRSDDKLTQSGAHYIIDTIVDLPTVIEDINSRMANGERP